MAVGGQDVICIRQKHTSSIPSTDLKLHLEDLGDHLFSDERSLSPLHGKTREGKQKVHNASPGGHSSLVYVPTD